MAEDKVLKGGPHGPDCKCPWPVEDDSEVETTTEVVIIDGKRYHAVKLANVDAEVINDIINKIPKDVQRRVLAQQFPRKIEVHLTLHYPEDQSLESLQALFDNMTHNLPIIQIKSAKDLASGEVCTKFE